jgi:biotin carboxyl carrier protein
VSAATAPPEGDDVHVAVRLVVAPSDGTFRPVADPADPVTGRVSAGSVLGHVVGPGRTDPVVAFCAARLVSVVVEPGERLRRGEPVAWLEPDPIDVGGSR